MLIEKTGYQYRSEFEITIKNALNDSQGKSISPKSEGILAYFLDSLTLGWIDLLQGVESEYVVASSSDCSADEEDTQLEVMYPLAAGQDEVRLLFRRPFTTDDLLYCFVHSILGGLAVGGGPLVAALLTGTLLPEAEWAKMVGASVVTIIAEAQAFMNRPPLGKDQHCVYLTARRNKSVGDTFTLEDVLSWYQSGRCVIATQRYLSCKFRNKPGNCEFNQSVDGKGLEGILESICAHGYLDKRNSAVNEYVVLRVGGNERGTK